MFFRISFFFVLGLTLSFSSDTYNYYCEQWTGLKATEPCDVPPVSYNVTVNDCRTDHYDLISGTSGSCGFDPGPTVGNTDDSSCSYIDYTYEVTVNCTCPDEPISIPDGKVIESISLVDSSQSLACPALDDNKVNECLALPGGEVITGRTDCCETYACVVDSNPQPDSNCTAPYIDDGNGNCVCDTSNGYSIDPKTDECTDCPNHYECIMSAGPNSDGMYINYYQVYDCLNVNYADAERTESFNCFDTDCPPGQYFCEKSPGCQLIGSECLSKASDTNDSQNQSCDYPPTLYEQPFQGIMSTQDCLDHGGWTYSCTDWTVACYYQDDNATDPFAGTTDDTNTDANSSGTIDDGNITSDVNMSIDLSSATTRLDTIIDSLSANGAIVKSIGDLSNSINSNLNGLKSSQDRTTDHIDGMNNNLAGKLDQTNKLLEDIKDNQNPDLNIDTSDLDAAFEDAKTIFNDALSSFDTSANDFKSLITGTGLPTVSASGDCFLSGSAPHIGSYRIDFDSLKLLRTGFQFLLNMFLFYFSIRLYTRIARDITGYLTAGL